MKKFIALLLFLPMFAFAQWVKIADERGSAVLDAPATVRFGLDSSWVEKTFPAGSFTCTLETFGSDPIAGTVKVCERKTAAPPPTPPTGTTLPTCWPKEVAGSGTLVRRFETPKGRVFFWYCPAAADPSGWTYHGWACRYTYLNVCTFTPQQGYMFSPNVDSLAGLWREFVVSDWRDPQWSDIMTDGFAYILANVPPKP